MSISKRRDSDIAYEKIKDMIIRGEVEQGSVVSVLYFSGLLGIGRMPIMVACQKLEVDGFLQIIPKQGLLINPVSLESARELYEARLAIESFLSERAFALLTKEDVVALEASIGRQRNLFAQKDAYGFMQEDIDFHRYILKKCPNSILLGMQQTLTDRIFYIGVKNSEHPERVEQAIDEHCRMVQAIRAGDKKAFLDATEANLIGSFQFMTATLTAI